MILLLHHIGTLNKASTCSLVTSVPVQLHYWSVPRARPRPFAVVQLSAGRPGRSPSAVCVCRCSEEQPEEEQCAFYCVCGEFSVSHVTMSCHQITDTLKKARHVKRLYLDVVWHWLSVHRLQCFSEECEGTLTTLCQTL